MKRLLTFALFIVLTLAACGSDDETGVEMDEEALANVNATGMPIVNEPIELTFFAGKSAQNARSDWNDILVWNHYADLSNINIDWIQVQTDGLEEQRNLALIGDDVPHAFYAAAIPNNDLFRYGEQGVFLRLNDLIEEYAPNLSQLIEEHPEIEKAITFPDGNIYSMPSIVDVPSVRIASRPWINKTWLDELEMDIPETTDEFYDFLVAVKELDPLGGGQTIPYGGTSMTELVQWLAGSFGVMNKGVRNGPIDVDENGDLRFYPITDEYRELLEYIHQLYSEGLVAENIFSIEWGQFLANAAEGQYASMVFYDPIELFGEEIGQHYDSMAALEGPNGHQQYVKVAPMVNTIGNFVITETNPNPAATVRWMDHFYSDEGAELYYMGVEGETFERTSDGEIVYADKIINPPEGSTFEQELAKYLTWLGTTIGSIKEDYFRGSEVAPASLEAAEKISPYVPEEVWPGFTYTDDETRFLRSTGDDIEKYVSEMQDKFIYGDESFDDWDQFVEQLESMGLEDYMDIKQAAYERYLE